MVSDIVISNEHSQWTLWLITDAQLTLTVPRKLLVKTRSSAEPSSNFVEKHLQKHNLPVIGPMCPLVV